MAKTVKMEIFRGGKQTDNSGNTREWTEADLDQIVKSTNSIGEEVPACVGHPKDNSPAFGWFKPSKVFREGKSLWAELSDTTKEFTKALKNKHYKNRSIALRNDKSIRHIAFLGASPPAIKGMEKFAFSEQEFQTFEPIDFTEAEFASFETRNAFGSIGRLLSNLRDFMIDTKDLETADKVLPDFMIDNIKEAENQKDPKPQTMPNFTEPTLEDPEMSELTELKAKFETLEGEFAESKKRIETLEGEVKTANEGKAAAEKEFSEHKANQRKGELNTWVESQIEAGKILPVDKEATLATMISIDGNEAHDFSEGDSTVKKTPLDVFKESIEAKESSVEFGEEFVSEKATEQTGTDAKISKMAKDRAEKDNISFSEGLERVLAENPNINQSIK